MVFAFQDGRSPLWVASLTGHLDVVKTLIEAGANANQTNKVCSPLHCHYTSDMLNHGAGNYTEIFDLFFRVCDM